MNALSYLFSLVFVGAPTYIAIKPSPALRTVPVLLLSDNVPGDCKCQPQVTIAFVHGGTNSCTGAGTPGGQPCFQAVIVGTPQEKDKKGTCAAPQIPGEPPIPACEAKECVYEPRKIAIFAAACAEGSACGDGPFQVVGNDGDNYGQPFGKGNGIEMTQAVGNRPCNSEKGYTIKLNGAGGLVAQWQLLAKCGQCTRLQPQ